MCLPHISGVTDASTSLGSPGHIPLRGHGLSSAYSRQLKLLALPPKSSRIKYFFPLCSLLCMVPSWATPYVPSAVVVTLLP